MKAPSLSILALLAACSPAAPVESAPIAIKASPAVVYTEATLPGAPKLILPLACEPGLTCELQNGIDRDPGPDALDYRCGRHTYQAHNGVDIRLKDMAAQRAGVAVLAPAGGTVSGIRDSMADISVKASGAPDVSRQMCGNGVAINHGGGWTSQYCHMARGSILVRNGQVVSAGQPLGRVGLSGNTEYPHLHMTVWKDGVVTDPFAPEGDPQACDPASAQGGLWIRSVGQALGYKRGVALNTGFAGDSLDNLALEEARLTPPGSTAPALLAYVRLINLEGGDEIELTVNGPDGRILTTSRQPPLDRAKAQYLVFSGRKTPVGGWPAGKYSARYRVIRDGTDAVTGTFSYSIR
jgi:hypothetical protein